MNVKEIYQENKEKLIGVFGHSFFQDVISLIMISIAGLMLLSLVLIIAFQVKSTETLIPLTYNSTFGVTTLGSWYQLYFYPFVYFVFSSLNIAIAWSFFEKERLISYLILFIHLIIGALLIIFEYYLTVLAVR